MYNLSKPIESGGKAFVETNAKALKVNNPAADGGQVGLFLTWYYYNPLDNPSPYEDANLKIIFPYTQSETVGFTPKDADFYLGYYETGEFIGSNIVCVGLINYEFTSYENVIGLGKWESSAPFCLNPYLADQSHIQGFPVDQSGKAFYTYLVSYSPVNVTITSPYFMKPGTWYCSVNDLTEPYSEIAPCTAYMIPIISLNPTVLGSPVAIVSSSTAGWSNPPDPTNPYAGGNCPGTFTVPAIGAYMRLTVSNIRVVTNISASSGVPSIGFKKI